MKSSNPSLLKALRILSLAGIACILANCGENAPKNVSGNAPDTSTPTISVWPAKIPAGDKVPKRVAIVFDASGSMAENNKLSMAKDALLTYLNSEQMEDVEVGLVAFTDNDMNQILELSPDKTRISNGVELILARGNTPLTEATNVAYKLLQRRYEKDQSYAEYHLAIITDGEANNKDTLESVVKQILDKTPVKITTIGFMIGETHSLNPEKKPANQRYIPAQSERGLKEGFRQILAEKEPEEGELPK